MINRDKAIIKERKERFVVTRRKQGRLGVVGSYQSLAEAVNGLAADGWAAGVIYYKFNAACQSFRIHAIFGVLTESGTKPRKLN